jgi:peptide/nickel transport system substrate-binding protein
MKKSLAAGLTALLSITGVGAATLAASADEASPPSRTTFTVGLTQSFDSLNPFIGVLASSYEVYGLVYDTLTGNSSKDFSPVEGLAESWDTSEDGLTWTFKIRSGVKWSDGEPLTAHDAAYTINRVVNGEFEQVNYGNYVATVTEAEAPDDTTLIVKTSAPTAGMLEMAIYILPEHIWKDIDSKQVETFENDSNIVGSGPFIFEEHKIGQYVSLKANKNYWGGAPNIDRLVFRVFNNEDAMVQALKKGEIDFVEGVSSNLFETLKNVKGITTVQARYSSFNEIAFNTGAATDEGVPIGDGHPALKDKRVRQAIAYAIDNKTLVDKVLRGMGSTGSSIVPPIYSNLTYDPGDKAYTFDLAKANQILDEAGYEKGSDGIRKMPDGKPLKFRLVGRQESQASQQVVPYVRGWLKEIGIAADVSIVEENRLTELIGNGEFDMFHWGWIVEPDPDYQLSTFTCAQRSSGEPGNLSAGLSDSFYCNDEYDALYEKQKTTIDPDERAQLVQQMQAMLYEDVPYVVNWYDDNLEAYRSDRFTGFVAQPEDGGSLLFQYGTYSYRNIKPVGGSSSSGMSTGLMVGTGIAAVVVIGVGAVFLRRQRATADERE